MSYLATPIFLLLAVITFYQPSPLCTVPGDFGYLSSMWFMYVVMGIVHASPWYFLLVPQRNLAATAETHGSPKSKAQAGPV